MKTRVIVSLLLISILIFSLFTPAFAIEIQSSNYISSAWGTLTKENASGQIMVSYSVYSSKSALTRIGVSQIAIYKADGTYVRSVYGTTSNGLIKTSGSVATGTYTFDCAPNTSYYAVVYFTVKDANGFDSTSRTTNTVTSPA